MVSPRVRREMVRFATSTFRLSERRACGLVGIFQSVFRYKSRKKDVPGLRERMRDLAVQRPRFGYRRLLILLRREGFNVNHKRIYRMYREEGLMVRRRKRKKFISSLRVVPDLPLQPNQRWSMDFTLDALWNGTRFRTLNIVDDYTRESLAIEVDTSLPGMRVARVLDRLAETRGLPKVIVVDNGPEFAGRVLDAWADKKGVKLHFIRPGKPVENAYIEPFNGKFRDECLNQTLFTTMEEAKHKIELWRLDYNRTRPHTALGGITPEQFASGHVERRVPRAPDLQQALR
ncbi:IS2 transposase TnpB [compost metagenome]